MHLIEQLGTPRRQFADQFLQVVQHGRQGKGEKEGGGAPHAQQQENDSQPLAGMPAPDVEPHNALDHRAEHHGEESADVEQQQNLAHQVRDQQDQSDGKGEDNVAPHRACP